MIFISHGSLDKDRAEELLNLLVARGRPKDSVFRDSDEDSEIRPGDEWQRVLYERLRLLHPSKSPSE